MSRMPTLKVTADFTREFNQTVKRFQKDAVLIGIPEDESARENGEFGNAAILAINTFGSEAAGIPPRDVLGKGIKNAQGDIVKEFKRGAVDALSRGAAALETSYNRVGTIASNSCKRVINDQDGIAPPSEATLKARKYITQSGFKGTKALLVTGQMRNAITYVLRSIWGK